MLASRGKTMKQIQVDMFAVGLGAAILTQIALPDGSIVTLLADGGMGPGYQADGVRGKLVDAFNHFRKSPKPKIDLIVGTHYDSDHLKGLLPIVRDESIEIGEVWLPPLKNDTSEIFGPLEDEDSLAEQFFDDEGGGILLNYLEDKAHQVDQLSRYEALAVDFYHGLNLDRDNISTERDINWQSPLPGYYEGQDEKPRLSLQQLLDSDHSQQDRIEQFRTFFEKHERDAASRTNSGPAHESASYDSSHPDAFAIVMAMRNRGWYLRNRFSKEIFLSRLDDDPDRARIVPVAFSRIRKSIASDAITATYVADVAVALRQRGRPIRPTSNFIAVGRPRRFVWTPSKQRFVRRGKGGETDLVLNLLGPSEDLVEKHRQKLPVGAYFQSLMYGYERINLEAITPSNQLSYIFTLETFGQRILISGDAGCYGFRDSEKKYYQDLLKSLTPLHVVQIAHHAGHNYDFYNTLLEAGFGQQEEPAFLLLSHAKHDEHRPSAAFGEFVEELRRQRQDPLLLFTSEPNRPKVEDYDDLIHKVVPKGGEQEEGDVRLCFQPSDSGGWNVELHAVSV